MRLFPWRSPRLWAIALLSLLPLACTIEQKRTGWPVPRPLGENLSESRLRAMPEEPGRASNEAFLEEPTGTITLRRALVLALVRNPELAASSWDVRAAEARRLQASLLPNPEVGLEVEEISGSGSRSAFKGAETTLSLGQLIELAGKRSKRTRVAALERDLRGWDFETKRLDIFTRTTKAFVDLLAAQRRSNLAGESLRLASQVFGTVSERVDAGKVSPLEQTRAEVELAVQRVRSEQAARELESARVALAATWGGRSPNFERAAGDLETTSEPPPIETLMARLERNPDLERWLTERELREAALELARAHRIPDPTLSAGVRRFEETDDYAAVVGVAIPIPVFNRNQGGILAARHDLQRATSERLAAEVRLRSTLQQSYQALLAASRQVTSLTREILPAATHAFEAVREGYGQGRFSLLDVLDAQRTLVQAREQLTDTLASYHLGVAEIERLIAGPLELSLDRTRASEESNHDD